MLNQMGLVVAWAFGAWRVYDQRITVGVLTAFLAYIARFYGRLESMTRMAGSTQRAAASAQRIFEVLDRAPSVAEPANPVPPGRLRGEVELRNVGFRFGNRRILDDVSLVIRPGETLPLTVTGLLTVCSSGSPSGRLGLRPLGLCDTVRGPRWATCLAGDQVRPPSVLRRR